MTRDEMIRRGILKPAVQPPAVTVYLDESGSFEGDEEPVVAGILVPKELADGRVLGQAFAAGLAGWGYPASPLPMEGNPPVQGVHAHLMRKVDPRGHGKVLAAIFDVLEPSGVRVFAIRDRCRTVGVDRNVAYAAVISRGISSYLVENPQAEPPRFVVAGRAVRDAIDTNRSLEAIIQTRVAEELAARGMAYGRLIDKVEVRHIKPSAFSQADQVPLLIADLVSNLLFSGRDTLKDAHERAQKLMVPGCPIEILPRTDLDSDAMLSRHGAGAFLVWFYGPAGPSKPSGHEKTLEARALGALESQGEAGPALSAFADAVDRLANRSRDLDSADRLARRLLSITDDLARTHGASFTTPAQYSALCALLDSCNHRGDIVGAREWIAYEAKRGRARREGLLLPSLEFRNRAAETAVNAYDFAGAAALLTQLLAECDALEHPVRGRIMSHRAQVHHYMGEDDQALRLYEHCEPYFDATRDRAILAHHRVRSLIGLGKFEEAREGLARLGVKDDLKGVADKGPFLLDLVVLFARNQLASGDEPSQLATAVLGAISGLRECVDTQYPGAATLVNLASVASANRDFNEAIACTTAALACLEGTRQPTLQSIALGAVLEGLATLRVSGREAGAQGKTWLTVANELAAKLAGERAVDSVRVHFASVKRGLADAGKLSARQFVEMAARVPFGRVGGCNGKTEPAA